MLQVINRQIYLGWLLSKFQYLSIIRFPMFLYVLCTCGFNSKHKQRRSLFFYIVLSIIFWNLLFNIRFNLKIQTFNILHILFRGWKELYSFLKNFIYLHYPAADSFSSELLISRLGNSCVQLWFYKFPFVVEVTFFLRDLEHLNSIFNTYKLGLGFLLKGSNARIDYASYLHMLKIPLFSKK